MIMSCLINYCSFQAHGKVFLLEMFVSIPICFRASYLLFLLQFGMLIEFLYEKFPNWEAGSAPAIGDLEVSIGSYSL